MIKEKELDRLLRAARQNVNSKFNPKGILFVERIISKVKRFKKLNEVEEKRLKQLAGENNG